MHLVIGHLLRLFTRTFSDIEHRTSWYKPRIISEETKEGLELWVYNINIFNEYRFKLRILTTHSKLLAVKYVPDSFGEMFETNLFKLIQTIPVLVEFYPSVVVRHICRILLLIFLRFIQRIIIAEKKMYFMVKPHTSVIWMIYNYIRATYGWHTTTNERHTDGTRVHTSDIRIAHNYIQKTYGWHPNDMRLT